MKLKSLITLVLTACLVVLTSNAMAKSDKSDKSEKSEKSAKSEKSEKSAKSGKSGKGYGHCKSDKSGKGHKNKRGKGHDRDCDDDEPPVLVCTLDIADIIAATNITYIEVLDEENEADGVYIDKAVSATRSGEFCNAVGELDELVGSIENDSLDEIYTTCTASDPKLGPRVETASNYSYDVEVLFTCSSPVAEN